MNRTAIKFLATSAAYLSFGADAVPNEIEEQRLIKRYPGLATPNDNLLLELIRTWRQSGAYIDFAIPSNQLKMVLEPRLLGADKERLWGHA